MKGYLPDFMREKKKLKHRYYDIANPTYPTTFFYFAVPIELANDISVKCSNVYPYAGVLGTNGGTVENYKHPRVLNNTALSFKHILYMVRSQSATLCRLARLVADGKQTIDEVGDEQFSEGAGTSKETV